MKLRVALLFTILVLIFSCRRNDEPVQQIDQVLHIYIDSLGQDMLNKNLQGSYFSVSMNDIDGPKDNSPVSFSLNSDVNKISYLHYIAGANRLLTDSLNPDYKKYRSRIALNLVTKINDSIQNTTNDTLVLVYTSTPQKFWISSAFYNKAQVFNKVEGQQNIIKIHK